MAALTPSISIKVIVELLMLSIPWTPTQADANEPRLTIEVMETKRIEISTQVAMGNPTHIVRSGINSVAPPSPNSAEEIPEMAPTATNFALLGLINRSSVRFAGFLPKKVHKPMSVMVTANPIRKVESVNLVDARLARRIKGSELNMRMVATLRSPRL